jgi:hypothetical protein
VVRNQTVKVENVEFQKSPISTKTNVHNGEKDKNLKTKALSQSSSRTERKHVRLLLTSIEPDDKFRDELIISEKMERSGFLKLKTSSLQTIVKENSKQRTQSARKTTLSK